MTMMRTRKMRMMMDEGDYDDGWCDEDNEDVEQNDDEDDWE